MPIASVLSKSWLTSDTYLLRTARSDNELKPGQCFSLGTRVLGINREYSIYSGINEAYLEFLVRRIPNGRISTALSDLKTGDQIEIQGPFGEFCISEKSSRSDKFLFIATGTGIAPFHSFISTYPNLDYELLHGVRFENETYGKEDYDPARYHPSISAPTGDSKKNRVTDQLRDLDVDRHTLIYLCGNRKMITDSVGILRTRGVSGSQIFMETFF